MLRCACTSAHLPTFVKFIYSLFIGLLLTYLLKALDNWKTTDYLIIIHFSQSKTTYLKRMHMHCEVIRCTLSLYIFQSYFTSLCFRFINPNFVQGSVFFYKKSNVGHLCRSRRFLFLGTGSYYMLKMFPRLHRRYQPKSVSQVATGQKIVSTAEQFPFILSKQ